MKRSSFFSQENSKLEEEIAKLGEVIVQKVCLVSKLLKWTFMSMNTPCFLVECIISDNTIHVKWIISGMEICFKHPLH